MTDLPSNLWKSPVIKSRLLEEAAFEGQQGLAEKVFYWVIVPEADSKDGTIVLKNFKPNLTDIEPHEMQKHFVKELQRFLMKEIHFNGMWTVGWTHPPTSYDVLTADDNCWNRLIFIWHDADGDPHYTLESEMPFIQMVESGMQYYAELANQAHEQWREVYSSTRMKSDMMLTEDQQTKASLEALKDA